MTEPNIEELEISCAETAALLEAESGGVLLIDVREPWEHQQANIPAARLIPLQQIPASLEEIRGAAATANHVLVHCAHGMRSLDAACFLREHGFPGARSVRGGIAAWYEELGEAGLRFSGREES